MNNNNETTNKPKIEEMRRLLITLNNARDFYYNKNEPNMSDYDYDNMFDRLQKLEEETGIIMSNSPTQTVGYEVKSELEKVKHSHSMLSLDKTKSENDLIAFTGDKECVLSLKMDGLTCLIAYENGELIQAETRGNGEIGEIVTHNAKVIENIPLTIPIKEHFEVEGEVIITYDDFNEINKTLTDDDKYKNPRNLASGSIRQLNSELAAKRHLKFICWKVPGDNSFLPDTFMNRLIFANKLGFTTVPFTLYNGEKPYENINLDIHDRIEGLKNTANSLGYPIDGMVLTYNDVNYGLSLGVTTHHPKHSIAFKFYDEEVETTLLDIDWTLGKTGMITPTVVFETVEIDGTDVSRASLHNISVMEELYPNQWHSGLSLKVIKANQIIPQVTSVEFRKSPCPKRLDPPHTCPVCKGETKIVSENNTKFLICTNPNCKGKLLKKFEHFCSKEAMDVDGMSEATLKFLINKGWINEFKDLYHLDQYKDEWSKVSGFGKRSVEKLLINIGKSRKVKLNKFINALSIPLIGKTASKDIAKASRDKIDTLIEILENECRILTKIDGFGDLMQKSLNKWWHDDQNKYAFYSLLEELEFENNSNNSGKSTNMLQNKTFVITGALNHYKNRNELVSVIELNGGKIAGSVSKKTDYLINNDINSESGKNKKAKNLGVPIITEDDFNNLIRKEVG